MASIFVRVERFDTKDEYGIRTRLVDEGGNVYGDEVLHRDMNCVRSYYNGMFSAWRELADVHGCVTLKQRLRWPFAETEFRVPANPGYIGDV